VNTISPELPDSTLSMETPCECCGKAGDVMLCLGDNRVFCSRYANGCMLKHVEDVPCKLVLSFLDLSVWDYSQNSYLDMFAIKELQPHYNHMHQVKFGEPAQFPNGSKMDPFHDDVVLHLG
jgi:hypothetical protein